MWLWVTYYTGFTLRGDAPGIIFTMQVVLAAHGPLLLLHRWYTDPWVFPCCMAVGEMGISCELQLAGHMLATIWMILIQKTVSKMR